MLVTSQLDLFPSEPPPLPEWSCPKWECLSRSVQVSVYNDCSLPSVQYSIPKSMKLTSFTISINMLKDEDCVRWIFCHIHKMFNCVKAGGGEAILCELHQCLSYIIAAVQNMCINGLLLFTAAIVRNMARLLFSVGTLKDFACSSDSLSTGVIEINYRFHAILILWTNALRLFNMTKDSSFGVELFYPPLTTEDSVLSQAAALLAYSYHIPFVCKCLKAAWEQLCCLLDEKFFSTFELLLGICSGSFQCPPLEHVTSVMLLDLYEARGTVDANVFLNIFCAFEPKKLTSYREGYELNSVMCCLQKIIARIPENIFIIAKISPFFEQLGSERLNGVDAVLQTLFNRLTLQLNGTHSKSLHYIPESGKQWLDYIFELISSSEIDSDDEWSLFINLLGKVLPQVKLFCSTIKKPSYRAKDAWKPLKARVFAKFTWKRLRELPLTSFTQLVSVYITVAISAELSEASEKILQLFSNIIGGSEKERVCLIMRGIHALLELFYHRHQDPVRIINALTICKFIIIMDKLSESDHADFYLESYLYVCDKDVRVNKLAKFLSNMSDMDVCRLLEKVENVENVDNLVWNIALSKLDSSFASQAVAFLSHQLRRAGIKDRQCAVVMMKSVVRRILVEEVATLQNCFNFLSILLENEQLQIDFAVEFLFPVWFLLVMLKLDSEEMLHISQCMYNGFRDWFKKLGITVIGMPPDSMRTTVICEKILQKLGTIPAEHTGILRQFLDRSLDSILPIVSNSLTKADQRVIENAICIVSYLFKYCGWLIFKPPSECSFNRSSFVKVCKIFLQNIFKFITIFKEMSLFQLITREFQETFLVMYLPNFFTGLLQLPVTSTLYVQRLLSEMIFKFGSVSSLRHLMVEQLKRHPDVVSALKKGKFKEITCEYFLRALICSLALQPVSRALPKSMSSSKLKETLELKQAKIHFSLFSVKILTRNYVSYVLQFATILKSCLAKM
uniref:DUF2428 domain-containing protein n=1 Tax=Syphacia muris TaxID=451379 RepID=A0A0N5AMQ4_9BILA